MPVLFLTIAFTSCADPSAGTGVPTFLKDVKAVAVGGNHTLAIDSDDKLWAWGYNYYGQLGDGTTTDSSLPVFVGEDDEQKNMKWKAVSAGNNHSLAIDENDKLWAWGYNIRGQLGDGTITQQNIPVPIGSATWKAVSAGIAHTLAIDENGKLWAWGYNDYGQVGDGSITDSKIPVQIGAKTWEAVSAGTYHSVAIDSDGKLWAWGRNDYGQLGDDSTTNSKIPVKLTGEFAEYRWKSVSIFYEHTAAVDIDGKLWAWGNNNYGQLGIGSYDDDRHPGPVYIGDKWKAIFAGGNHSVAIKIDGVLWSWGDNSYGQLGNGTATNENVPKRVILHR